MAKQYKILLFLGGFFVLGLVGFVIINSLPSPETPIIDNNQNNQVDTTTNVPDYMLSAPEEASLQEFVKNYVNLYNSYSYGDYSNLTALGDYQTQSMQEETLNSIAKYEETLPIGYQISTEADAKTFSYSYPSSDSLSTTISAEVSEVLGENLPSKKYKATIDLEIGRQKTGWLVKDIKINKQ